jgi:putative holliday junction resolvase
LKILALDIGDQWTGIAISDAIGMFARPLQTVTSTALATTLTELTTKERISTVIVGLPRTMKGTESDQTRKVREAFEALKTTFAQWTWILWDERLSSKRAQSLQIEQGKRRSQETKHQEHAVAAAFILQTYLDSLVRSQG